MRYGYCVVCGDETDNKLDKDDTYCNSCFQRMEEDTLFKRDLEDPINAFNEDEEHDG